MIDLFWMLQIFISNFARKIIFHLGCNLMVLAYACKIPRIFSPQPNLHQRLIGRL